MALLSANLPENALINVRDDILQYFGDNVKLTAKLVDNLLDDAVKMMHRRYHPKWAEKYYDVTIAADATAAIQLPADFKKILEITNQSFTPDTIYINGEDYKLFEYTQPEDDTAPRRQLQWLTPPTTATDIRITYVRKPRRASADDDLLDIEDDASDILKTFCQSRYELQRGNTEESDRLEGKANKLLQEYINDDTEPDKADDYRPENIDGSRLNFEEGELLYTNKGNNESVAE